MDPQGSKCNNLWFHPALPCLSNKWRPFHRSLHLPPATNVGFLMRPPSSWLRDVGTCGALNGLWVGCLLHICQRIWSWGALMSMFFPCVFLTCWVFLECFVLVVILVIFTNDGDGKTIVCKENVWRIPATHWNKSQIWRFKVDVDVFFLNGTKIYGGHWFLLGLFICEYSTNFWPPFSIFRVREVELRARLGCFSSRTRW